MPLELQVAFSGTTCNNNYKKQEDRIKIKIEIKMAGGGVEFSVTRSPR